MHPAVRTLLDLLLAALVTGAVAAIDYLSAKLPGQPGLLDSREGWLLLLAPIVTAGLSGMRRWLTDWQQRKPLSPAELADRVDEVVAIQAARSAAPDAVGTSIFDQNTKPTSISDDLDRLEMVATTPYAMGLVSDDDGELDVETNWRRARREAKQKKRELRNQPENIRQSALLVVVGPFLNAVIGWAVANIGPKIIDWLQNLINRLRQRYPQPSMWEPIRAVLWADVTAEYGNRNSMVRGDAELIIPQVPMTGGWQSEDADPILSHTGQPMLRVHQPPPKPASEPPRSGPWAEPPLDGLNGIRDN